MGIDGDIKRRFLQPWQPQFAARQADGTGGVLTFKPKGDVMNEDMAPGLFIGFGGDFLLQEVGLVAPEGIEIVQAIIHPRGIGLVLTTVEHDEAGVAPGEGMIGGTVALPFKETGHAGGVGIADFMVAAQEDAGDGGCMEGTGQLVNILDGVFACGRLGEAVAIEHDKIMGYRLRQG